MSLSSTPDTGWLLCDGTQYNRADYPALAALIPESTPNIGGDENVFFVPNMAGRVPVGAGGAFSWTPARQMGQVGGTYQHTLTLNEIPAHQHETFPTNTGSGDRFISGADFAGNTTGDNRFKTFPAGGGNPHNNMPPFFVAYYHIYAGV